LHSKRAKHSETKNQKKKKPKKKKNYVVNTNRIFFGSQSLFTKTEY